MPKPVLSDSLFNADDVATAVLAEANLQITNDNLGVSVISSIHSLEPGWSVSSFRLIYFNGFVYWSGLYSHAGGIPNNGEVFAVINDADYRPTDDYVFPSTGYQADSNYRIRVATNGNIIVDDPVNQGQANYYIVVNGFWHIDY